MSGIREWLAGLPSPLRWGLIGAVAVLLLVVVGSAVWTLLERREAAAQQSLAVAVEAAHRAIASGQGPELEAAATGLKQFLNDHPRSRAAAQAWYVLGDVEFRRGQWDAAAAAFARAAAADSGSIGALSRLGQGYALEAKGEPARALEAYQQALAGRSSKDFLYGELLLAKARAHEQEKDSSAAIETYRRYLKDLPSGDRADEVRIRLGLLGADAA